MTGVVPQQAAAPRTRGRRWAWLPTLVVGVGLFEAVRRTLIDTGNPNLVPTLILIGAAVVPAAFVAFLSGRRFGYEVSGWVLAITALVGGVIGVVLAGFWEYQSLHRLGTTSVLVVGLAEETAKLVVPAALLLLLRKRHRHPANGLLIGVACGAGFAALETMGYAFVTLIQSHGNLAAVDGLLVVRGLLSPAGHMAWTGLTAAALWFAADRRWQPRASLRFVLAFVLAVGLHATWDAMRSTGGLVVVAAVSVVALVVTTVSCSRGEWAREPRGHVGRLSSTGVPAHPFVG